MIMLMKVRGSSKNVQINFIFSLFYYNDRFNMAQLMPSVGFQFKRITFVIKCVGVTYVLTENQQMTLFVSHSHGRPEGEARWGSCPPWPAKAGQKQYILRLFWKK